MNQVKYLIYASLLFIGLFITFLFYSLLPKGSQQESITTNEERNSVVMPLTPGKAIFQQNCQSCHALDKKLSGPALRGVLERGPWVTRGNIYKWIHNPAAFIPTTPYTKALQAEYGQIMPSFPQLSEKDIDAILEQISKDESSQSMPVALY
jgi:mono/diheme cytochrome c family protein